MRCETMNGDVMGLFSRKPKYEIKPGKTSVTLFDGDGGYHMAVVGESNYQGALRRSMADGGVTTKKGQASAECVALLLPEPDNQFDSNAVAVLTVHGKVGYLSRDDAAAWHREICNAWDRGGCAVGVNARIYRREEMCGIWLDWPDDFNE